MRARAGATRRCAVLGSPVRHSLSPTLHRAAYAALGLDWTYDAVEVDEAGLADFLGGLGPAWRGLSLTMPLKRAACALADEVVGVARDVEAANTLVVEAGGRLVAHNTDVDGMAEALRERGVDAASGAAVLGGGATAASAVAALARLGTVDPVVYARSPTRAADVVRAGRRLGVEAVVRPWTEVARALDSGLVVSTTPAGATDALAASVRARAAGGRVPGTLFEVLYDPWPTPLAAAWAEAGAPVLGGLDLLVHQAVLQVRLFTGRDVEAEVLRAAGAAVLAERRRR